MRWNKRKHLEPKEGEERIVRKFLWLPRSLPFSNEIRWLEKANIVERVNLCLLREWEEICFEEDYEALLKREKKPDWRITGNYPSRLPKMLNPPPPPPMKSPMSEATVKKVRSSSRPETGSMVFEDDWPGLFIRGDDCAGLNISLKTLFDQIEANEEKFNNVNAITVSYCKSILGLLTSPMYKKDNECKNIMKKYNDCIRNESEATVKKEN